MSALALKIISGTLWQGSYRKIENYGSWAVVTLFGKVLQPFFGMSTQLVTVQTMVYYFDKDYLSLVHTHAQMRVLKKLKTAKCSPKRPQIGIWIHLNMLYLNTAGSLKFFNFAIVYGPFIV